MSDGSGVSGAASKLSQTIAAAGYQVAPPANTGAITASAVHFIPGYEAEAKALAATLKPAPPVTAMPSPQPIADLRGAQVLVLQAKDLAG